MNNRGASVSREKDTRHDRVELGERLRAAREYLGLRQDEVAKSIGLARSALSNIERGARGVDALELKKLARLYHRPTRHFTGEDPEQPAMGEDVEHLARAVSKLSSSDKEELARFAEYLRARSRSTEDSNG